MNFEPEEFTARCRAALKDSDPQEAVDDLVRQAVSRPGAIITAMGEPRRAGIQTICRAPDLTILNVMWGPHMNLHPHDHRMWAVIGVYGGREDNTFYRRNDDGLTQHGTKVLEAKETIALGETVIHSVANPLQQITAAIHIYPGDFFDTPRSEWDPETFEEHPYDVEHTLRVFEASNRALED